MFGAGAGTSSSSASGSGSGTGSALPALAQSEDAAPMSSARFAAEQPVPNSDTVTTYPDMVRFAVTSVSEGMAEFPTIDDDDAVYDYDYGDVSVATWNVMDASPVQPGPFLPQFVGVRAAALRPHPSCKS